MLQRRWQWLLTIAVSSILKVCTPSGLQFELCISQVTLKLEGTQSLGEPLVFSSLKRTLNVFEDSIFRYKGFPWFSIPTWHFSTLQLYFTLSHHGSNSISVFSFFTVSKTYKNSHLGFCLLFACLYLATAVW